MKRFCSVQKVGKEDRLTGKLTRVYEEFTIYLK